MFCLNLHRTTEYFKNLKNKIINLIKTNETYIINNCDSIDIKNILIFLAYNNKYYKQSFIYLLTHRIIDLYINDCCDVHILSVFLHNLIIFTKQKYTYKNKFNHTIRNTKYNAFEWLNDNNVLNTLQKNENLKEIQNNIDETGTKNDIINVKVKKNSILQLLSIYICKNVYFINLSSLTSLLRSLSYLFFNDINFYNVFIPLFMKHMEKLSNKDILNITHAYNKQKIKNKYFYYLLSKQFQQNNINKLIEKEIPIKLIG